MWRKSLGVERCRWVSLGPPTQAWTSGGTYRNFASRSFACIRVRALAVRCLCTCAYTSSCFVVCLRVVLTGWTNACIHCGSVGQVSYRDSEARVVIVIREFLHWILFVRIFCLSLTRFRFLFRAWSPSCSACSISSSFSVLVRARCGLVVFGCSISSFVLPVVIARVLAAFSRALFERCAPRSFVVILRFESQGCVRIS